MDLLSAVPFSFLADATAAANDIKSFVTPMFATLVGLASVVCAAFLVIGGYTYITSSGKPDNLARAKKIIRNALIGLAVVVAAGVLTAFLNQSYSAPPQKDSQSLPTIQAVEYDSGGASDVIIKAIIGLFTNIIISLGAPILNSLNHFLASTPLMADNGSVFALWVAMVAIADVLFMLVIAMLGFHIMSADTLGFDEVDFKHLLPQIGLVFLLVNSSIFAIDAIISLSNALIHALQAGFPSTTVIETLTNIVKESSSMGVAALLIVIAFIVLAALLLVYYLMRLVVLFLGAVLAPLVLLLWLLPSFRDFANTAIRAYITTIFVLFVHVVILTLAASLLQGAVAVGPDDKPDPVMSVFLGIATLAILLKTQGMMTQLAFMSSGARSARKMGTQFVKGMSHLGSKVGQATGAAVEARYKEAVTQARTTYLINQMGAGKK